MFDESLTNFLTRGFWPSYLFVNEYPVLAVIWNLFLAVIPLVIYYFLVKISEQDIDFTKKATVRLLFFFWLLFLPNSAYIVTEIRHLSGMYNEIGVFNRQMYDVWIIAFFFAYAIVGYFIYYFSIVKMLNLLENKFFVDKKVFLPLITFFSSLGVLIGLVNRWNSWEIFVRPREIFIETVKYFIDWEYFKNLIVIFLFYYFLHLMTSYFIKTTKDE